MEEDLKGLMVKGINKLLVGKDEYTVVLKKNIETSLGESNDETFEEIEGKLKVLQNELLKLARENRGQGGSHSESSRTGVYDKVTNEILNLNELKEKAMIQKAEGDGQKKRIDAMVEFMEARSGVVYEFDEILVRRLIDRVIVKADGVKLKFKSGFAIEG
jgi:site-specific DNA recombinase